MSRKLFAVIMVLILSLFTQFVFATEKGGAKVREKIKAKSAKCWERMPPLEESLMSPEYGTVCKAFEEVLNTTCESPEKLQCNWSLPAGEKRFKKLTWEQLDWKEYWGIIGDLRVSGVRKDLRDNLWKNDEERIRKLFEESKCSIAITKVDIDHDGNVEIIVRDDNQPCEGNAGVTFGVMNPLTKRMDWSYEDLIRGVNAFNEGAEVMLYNGQTFMFKWERDFKAVYVYEGFNLLPNSESRGSINICRFKYLKGGK
ncbi:MAG: hypothetical protein ABIK92_03270 [Pseudomonadota bacterium]